jgi:YD repeat-containing protein
MLMIAVAAIGFLGATAALLTSRSQAQAAPTPGSVTYRYDSLGRIVQDIYPANSVGYNYDAAGNRTSMTLN